MHHRADVLPSVHDIVGAPIAGLPVVRMPSPPSTQFRDVLRNLRVQPTVTGVGSAAIARGARAPGAIAPREATGGARAAGGAHGARAAVAMGGRPSGVAVAGSASRRTAVAGVAGSARRAGVAGVARSASDRAGVAGVAADRPVAESSRAGSGLGGEATRASGRAATEPSPAWQARLAAMRPDYSRPAGTVRPLKGEARAALVASIEVASADAGVAPELSIAVARAESQLDPTARSSDGKSVGTFQVTATTAAEMRRKIARGDVERPRGHDDVAFGVGYLRYLDGLFGKETRLGRGLATVPVEDAEQRRLFTVAAYNAGEGRVAQAQARAARAGLDPTRFAQVKPFLPGITQAYVERVRGYLAEAGANAVA